MKKCFRGGHIASENSADLVPGDVIVDRNGIIQQIGADLDVTDCEVIDCTGKILVPGMCDFHVHPKGVSACLESAHKGGISQVVLMPDHSPVIDTGERVRMIEEKVEKENSPVRIHQMGAISKRIKGEKLAAIAGMADAGVPMLTDSPETVHCPILFKRAMEYSIEFDLPLATRGDVAALSKGGAMNEGPTSYYLGLPGIPSIAEEIGIERDLKIAKYTGGRIHIQQISTAGSLQAIKRAREDGVQVTCEVSPHHLIYSEEAVGEYNTNFKVMPPLRLDSDAEALVEGLVAGDIDVIATDHMPFTKYEKLTDFGNAPFGRPGLEIAVSSLYSEFIANGVFGWDVLIKRFSAEPRRMLKAESAEIKTGNAADFFLFDPEKKTGKFRGAVLSD